MEPAVRYNGLVRAGTFTIPRGLGTKACHHTLQSADYAASGLRVRPVLPVNFTTDQVNNLTFVYSLTSHVFTTLVPCCRRSHWQESCPGDSSDHLSLRRRRSDNWGRAALNVHCWIRDTPDGIDEPPTLAGRRLGRLAGIACLNSQIRTSQRKVRKSVRLGPPALTVDTAIFEMSLGSLSAHQGLAIPVV